VAEAHVVAEQAQAKGLDSPFLRILMYQIAFLQLSWATLLRHGSGLQQH
jgi:hypothetical protein